MSGAVGSPFTASMFRFDGVKLQESLLSVNNKSCIYSCEILICLFLKAIYFAQTKKSRTEQGGIVSEVRSGYDFG